MGNQIICHHLDTLFSRYATQTLTKVFSGLCFKINFQKTELAETDPPKGPTRNDS